MIGLTCLFLSFLLSHGKKIFCTPTFWSLQYTGKYTSYVVKASLTARSAIFAPLICCEKFVLDGDRPDFWKLQPRSPTYQQPSLRLHFPEPSCSTIPDCKILSVFTGPPHPPPPPPLKKSVTPTNLLTTLRPLTSWKNIPSGYLISYFELARGLHEACSRFVFFLHVACMLAAGLDGDVKG